MLVTIPLRAHGLGVSLGGNPILRDVSLEVGPSDVVALLGGNGSGKTTLLRALLGLIEHEHGTVELFGTPLERFREWHRIGYVPQRASLTMHSTTVAELVTSGTLSRRRPFMPTTRAMRNRVHEAIDRVGLSAKANEAFVHLSGGQQQRVLIARAMVSAPEVLVMDEPFAGVDLATQQRLVTLVSELHASGVSVLVVLHETAAFADLVTRAIVLSDGRITHDGPLLPGVDHLHESHGPARTSPILEGVQPWTS